MSGAYGKRIELNCEIVIEMAPSPIHFITSHDPWAPNGWL